MTGLHRFREAVKDCGLLESREGLGGACDTVGLEGHKARV